MSDPELDALLAADDEELNEDDRRLRSFIVSTCAANRDRDTRPERCAAVSETGERCMHLEGYPAPHRAWSSTRPSAYVTWGAS